MSGTLSLGVDSSGVKAGAAEIVRSLSDIRQAALDAAAAMRAVGAGSGSSPVSGMAQDAGRATQGFNALDAAIKATNTSMQAGAAAMASLGAQAQRTTDYVARLNASLGVKQQSPDDYARRAADIAAYGQQMDALRAKYVPLAGAQQQYSRALAEISNAEKVGAITASEAAAARTTARRTFDDAALALTNTTRATREGQKATSEAGQEVDRLAGLERAAEGATDNFARALDLVRGIAVGVGVSLAGLGMADFVSETTLAAARYETLGVVLDRVGQNTQFSANQINSYAAGVQKMGISMTESRETIIRLIQAQVDLSKATELARVAQDAAVVANTNSSDALGRMVASIVSGNTEMLRYLGLHVSFQQSYQQEAALLGKSVNALTAVEQTQARMNAVIQQGVAISGAYTAAMDTASKQLGSMRRYAEDASVKLGGIFNDAFTSLVMQASHAMQDFNRYLDSPAGQERITALSLAFKSLADNIGTVMGTVAGLIGGRLIASLATAIASGRALAMVGTLVGGSWGLALSLITGALAFMLTREDAASQAADRINAWAKEYADTQDRATASVSSLTEAEKALYQQRQQQAADDAVKRQQKIVDAARADLSTVQSDQIDRITGLATRAATVVPFQMMNPSVPQDQRDASRTFRTDSQAFLAGKMDLADYVAEVVKLQAVLGNTDGMKALRDSITSAGQVVADGTRRVEALSKALDDLKARASAAGYGIAPNMTNLLEAYQRSATQNGMTVDVGSGSLITETQKHADALKEAYAQAVQGAKDTIAYNERVATASRDGSKQQEVALLKVQDAQRVLNNLLRDQAAIQQMVANTAMSAAEKQYQIDQQHIRNAKLGERGAARANAYDDYVRQLDRENVPQGDRKRLLDAHMQAYDAQFGMKGSNALAGEDIRVQYARRVAEAEGDGAAAVRAARAEMDRYVAAAQGGQAAAEATAKAREAEETAIGKAVANLKTLARSAAEQTAAARAGLTGGLAGQRSALDTQRAGQVARDLGPGHEDIVGQTVDAMRTADASQRAKAAADELQRRRDELEVSRAEVGLISQNKDARTALVEQVRIEQAMEHDLIGASGAQADAIRAIYAEQIKVNAETAKYKVALAQADELRQAGQQMGSAFTSAFGAAIQGGQKLGDVLKSLLTSIENIILKLTVEKWLTDAISGATSGGGFLGGLFGGAAKVAPVATPLSLVGSGLSTVAGIPNARGGAYANSTLGGMDSTILRAPTTFSAFAKGGAFDGIASLGDLTDSIVRAPTYFRPFATGGLAGEVGPEAIMPLSRGSDGTLGVHVTSGGGGGSTPITVNAPITIQGGVNGQTGQMDPKVMAQMQNDLMRALDNAISQKIDQEKRPGGKLY